MENFVNNNFSQLVAEAMYLAGILQQKGLIDMENDLIKNINEVKNPEELENILAQLRSMNHVEEGRSSDYR